MKIENDRIPPNRDNLLLVCGILCLCSYVGLVVLSRGLANRTESIPSLNAARAGLVIQGTGVMDRIVRARGVILAAILAVTTAGPLLLLFKFSRPEARATARTSRAALCFAVLFGVVCAFASPMFVFDFWYYIAAGRLAAAGGNVYVDHLRPSLLAGLPPVQFPGITMPYGPAWSWLSELLSRIAGSNIVLEFLAYKSALCAAWILTLVLVYRELRESPFHQLNAILIFGWLPLSVVEVNAEGHNDIIMMVLLTGWLLSRKPASCFLLVASVLVKYASAPAMLVAALDSVVRRSAKTILALAVSGVVGAVVFAYEWNGGALLAGLQPNRANMDGFSPVSLITYAAETLRLPGSIAAIAILVWRVLLVAFVVVYGRRHLRQPSAKSLCALVTAVMLAALLGSSYFWPWYLLWVFPSLILSLDPFLMKGILPLVSLMPFISVLRSGSIHLSMRRATGIMYLILGTGWIVVFLWKQLPARGENSKLTGNISS